LLEVAEGSRSSQLDRLRRAPTRASGIALVNALDRVSEIAGLGAGLVELGDIPPGRLEVLARHGKSAKAATLRRLPPSRRAATLLATVRGLETAAVDDALDVFAVLMATKLIPPAQRVATADRLRALPRLAEASAVLAAAARVLLELVDTAPATQVDPGAVWAAVPRERLAAAVATVAELAPHDGDPDAAVREELVRRYNTIRPFLPMLAGVLPLAATDTGRPVLAATQGMAGLVGRKRLRRKEIDESLVTGSWRRLVFRDPDAAAVDHRAWALCVLDALHRALRRREVYAERSARWGRPASTVT
jgi:hypothetical protein